MIHETENLNCQYKLTELTCDQYSKFIFYVVQGDTIVVQFLHKIENIKFLE